MRRPTTTDWFMRFSKIGSFVYRVVVTGNFCFDLAQQGATTWITGKKLSLVIHEWYSVCFEYTEKLIGFTILM